MVLGIAAVDPIGPTIASDVLWGCTIQALGTYPSIGYISLGTAGYLNLLAGGPFRLRLLVVDHAIIEVQVHFTGVVRSSVPHL